MEILTPVLIEKMSEEFTKIHINPNGSLPINVRPVIHRFRGTDKGGPHCHPWGFWSFVIFGSYVERVYGIRADGTWHTADLIRKTGDAFFVPAKRIHEIIELPDGECQTIVLPGEWERESMFWKFDETGIYNRPWHRPEFSPYQPA